MRPKQFVAVYFMQEVHTATEERVEMLMTNIKTFFPKVKLQCNELEQRSSYRLVFLLRDNGDVELTI